MRLLIMMLGYMALASPIVCLVGIVGGIWARRTRLAPRLGLSLVALAIFLALCEGIFLVYDIVYDRVRPHGGRDLDRLVVGILTLEVFGLQSLMLTLLIVTTIAVALKQRKTAANQASQAIGEPQSER
jgi:hypothetical protein